ncbi:Uncharacterized protein QJS10_CPB22g01499 [Acorus calamus]|uniref:Damage-control phosphatase ARMT1-like metal-binding domain-containing protein n=1 Tax=Acorus calamus TaxID=4465 RepID=A0AAV9C1X8_ACOCL|nr:Uncharacterized protein QJS10_CPB22g01499 [Acorus calamus]
METTSPMVPFPLLPTPIETNYKPCTVPYRFPSDDPRKPTQVELDWIDLFLDSVPSLRKQAESDSTVPDAPVRAEKFAQRIQEQVLRELGFVDIFKKVKDEENAKAIVLFEDVVCLNDAIEDGGKRVENLIRGILAGNIFDLGSPELAEVFARDGMSFLASCQNLASRPWVIDDLENFKLKWNMKSWKKASLLCSKLDARISLKAVIFVDNSGADIILGILPFARELLRRGTQPEDHELSDTVTNHNFELSQLTQVIDLRSVSQELAYLASDADLVVLEGMGRSLETNLYAQLKCDSIKIGMIKHPEIAQFLGGSLYNCVFKYTEVN